ncbi:hypothetical protein C5167_002628 [Papaver somniferum]|uniref:Uncharacterized protein n=1 Tax=Papaver somniferum TaxID=3469 RepID=A0A4Y7KZW3_PAPSO|nr:uncharacterized protein LOC113312587 [Papaver somniferum]RZC78446.1 hypothetical protein C5167_002628 [Papaver somniferum]
MESKYNEDSRFGTRIYVTALDSIINVNSIFAFAVFIGLAWNPSDPNNTLINDPQCTPGNNVREDFISFQVFSFGCFVFSSIIALALKQALKIARNNTHIYETMTMAHNSTMARVNKTVLRVVILGSAIGSLMGFIFLMSGLVNLVQIKLGVLSCPNNGFTLQAVVPLVILVPSALVIYSLIVVYAFIH